MKKTQKLLAILLFLPLFIACSSDDNSEITLDDATLEEVVEAFSSRESSCGEFTGYAGAYWDFVLDIPLLWPTIPEITEPESVFTHSELPITLELPVTYQAVETVYPGLGPDVKGVEVMNANRTVSFTWIPPTYVPEQYIVVEDFMVYNRYLLEIGFGLNGDPPVLCSELIHRDSLGFPQEIMAEVIQFNNFTAQVWTITSYLDEGTTYAIAISVAPDNDYRAATEDLFAPLHYQLYMQDQTTKIDQDGDGFSYLSDPNDNDSSVPSN